MNKSYGLIMSKPMILAYLDGRKTQTRRTKGLNKINENSDQWHFEGFTNGKALFLNGGREMEITLPYGRVGDTLYFKETYQLSVFDLGAQQRIYYKADVAFPVSKNKILDEIGKWRSPMFMKREYSRFYDIPILKVRVERLHDITEDDAQKEGVSAWHGTTHGTTYISPYSALWDSINAKRGYSWENNGWVWVYEFPKYK
jgi:hypothetical protein